MTVNGPGWGEVDLDAAPPPRRRVCTKREAHWCPTHGVCRCTEINERGARVWMVGHRDDCPLHGATTTHPIVRKVRTFTRRPT